MCGRRFRPSLWDGHSSAGAGAYRGRRPEPWPSSAHLLQLQVAHQDLHIVLTLQTLCKMFREEDRAMLAAGAADRDHQIFEAALLIAGDTCINEREAVGECLVNASLRVYVAADRGSVAL